MTSDEKPGFTKGPWFAEKAFVYALNDQGTNRFFAGVQDAFTPKSELEANARLIAAAPELYAAVEGLLEAYKTISEADDRDKSDRAINTYIRAERAAVEALAKAVRHD